MQIYPSLSDKRKVKLNNEQFILMDKNVTLKSKYNMAITLRN